MFVMTSVSLVQEPFHLKPLEFLSSYNSSSSTGSIPEEDGGKLYNTCTVFGPDGEMILKHRKVCVGHIQCVVSCRDESSSSFFFPPLRFTCLTSTFPEESASRNLRRWARGAVYRCLTHVSDSRRLWLSASQSGWAYIDLMCSSCSVLQSGCWDLLWHEVRGARPALQQEG